MIYLIKASWKSEFHLGTPQVRRTSTHTPWRVCNIFPQIVNFDKESKVSWKISQIGFFFRQKTGISGYRFWLPLSEDSFIWLTHLNFCLHTHPEAIKYLQRLQESCSDSWSGSIHTVVGSSEGLNAHIEDSMHVFKNCKLWLGNVNLTSSQIPQSSACFLNLEHFCKISLELMP